MEDRKTERRSESDHNLIRVMMVILLALIVVILSLRSCGSGGEEAAAVVLAPDYAAIEADDNAEAIQDDDAERPEVEEGGGSVTVSYRDDVRYSLAADEITLLYQNPSASTHDVVVQVIIVRGGDEYLLGQSGLLQPGYEVARIDGADGAPELSPGGYDGKLKLLFYDHDTGERAIVDNDIPVTITVE